MARVKRSVHARKKRRKVLEEAKGYFGLKKSNYTYAKEQVERSLAYAYRDRKVRKREFRKLWIMRINAGARANGLSYNQFMAGLKAANVELDRKILADLAIADPAKFGEIVQQAKAALAQIDAQSAARDLRAAGRLLRRPLAALCARLPPARRRPAGRRRRARSRVGPAAAAARRAALPRARRRGVVGRLDAALERHGAFLRRWCAEQEVQTNEVQRSWALLPAFLSLDDGRPFDLLELGPSAGLNLLWDRYAYRYSSGAWGSGELELRGDDRLPPPAALFERRVEVVRRRGVDLSPIDVTTAEGARVLQAFVWPDQTERLDRLRRAIDVARARPAGADPRRLRRRAAVAPARPHRRRAARRLPDRVDDVSRPSRRRAPAGGAARGGRPRAARLRHDRPRARTTTASRSRSSGSRADGPSAWRCSTSTARGSTGADDRLAATTSG